MEQFKRISADYEIGTCGTARSLKWGKVKILTPVPNRDGYLYVCLHIEGQSKTLYVHRLVAQAFIPNPLNLREINHINGDKTDNRVENLEWCTRSKNIRHAYDTGLEVASQGEDRPNAKLTNEQARYVRDNPDKLNIVELSKMFGVTKTTISSIQLGKTYKTAGGSVRSKSGVPADVRAEIRRLYVKGDLHLGAKPLARRFGISASTVKYIVRGKN